jgi:hypothetical protein
MGDWEKNLGGESLKHMRIFLRRFASFFCWMFLNQFLKCFTKKIFWYLHIIMINFNWKFRQRFFSSFWFLMFSQSFFCATFIQIMRVFQAKSKVEINKSLNKVFSIEHETFYSCFLLQFEFKDIFLIIFPTQLNHTEKKNV